MKHQKSSRRSIGILLGLAATGLGLQACSSDGTSSTSTTGGDGGAASSSSTTTSSAGGAGGASGTSTTVGVGGATSSSASSSSASTGTGGPGCTEITVADWELLNTNGKSSMYSSTVSPNLGSQTSKDNLFLEFYGSGIGATYDGEKKGTFDLSAAADSNYGTCSRCLIVYEDPSDMVKYFFQKSGSLVIDATSDQLNGTIKATITDLTLIEVELDSMGSSTVVPDGACRHLASATITIAK